MKITTRLRQQILKAMTAKGLNGSTLSLKLGKNRTYMAKILAEDGGIEEISDKIVDGLADHLEIPIRPVQTVDGPLSPTAIALSEMADSDPVLGEILDNLLKVKTSSSAAYLPYVETKRLPKIGAEITKIVMKWEQPNDPHYSKIAVEVLELLRDFYAKQASK
jgi:hypothetical protein